jgi:hypothetical protein
MVPMIPCGADGGLLGRGIIPAAAGCPVPQFIRRQTSRHGTGKCAITRILVRGIGRCAFGCVARRGSFLIILPSGGLDGAVLWHALPFWGRLSTGLLCHLRASFALCTAPTIRLLPGLLLIKRSESKYPDDILFELISQRFQTQLIMCSGLPSYSNRSKYLSE